MLSLAFLIASYSQIRKLLMSFYDDDDAKKPAKRRGRKKAQELFDPASLDSVVSAFVDSATADLAKEYNEDAICLLGEADKLLIGIPFPSFGLELIFGVNALPLGRIVQIVGTEGVYKSALGFEVIRWFCEQRGMGFLLEHETKFNPMYARSIIGWHRPRGLSHIPCDSINDWQKFMQASMARAQAAMLGTAAKPGPGKVWPIVFDVDSVMAKATEATQDKIEEEGYAGKGFPVEALSITSFMRKVPKDIRKWPFLILLINHLKPSKDERGFAVRNKAGGRGLSFQETFEIEMDRHMHFEHNTKEFFGRRLIMKMHKNSMGADRMKMPVEVRWHYEDVDDVVTGRKVARQMTQWCWHEATFRMLTNDESGYPSKIRKILDLQLVKGNTCVVSKALGISEDSPASFDEAGAILLSRDDILAELRRVCGVAEIKVFQPGVDYDSQMRAVKEAVASAYGLPVAEDQEVAEDE